MIEAAAGRIRMARPKQRSGREWAVFAGRLVLWALVFILLLRGVVTIFQPRPKTPAPLPLPASVTFPSVAAEGLAVQFARAYLSFDELHPEIRQKAIAALLPGGDASAGWDGHGRQEVTSVIPLRIDVSAANEAVVRLAVELDGVRNECVAVSTLNSAAGLAVEGTAVFVSCPTPVSPPAQATPAVDDQLSQRLITDLATPFFRSYGVGSQSDLNYFLGANAKISGLGGALVLDHVASFSVPVAGGERRDASAVVVWNDPGSGAILTQTYRVEVMHGEQDRWYVSDLGTLTQSKGTG